MDIMTGRILNNKNCATLTQEESLSMTVLKIVNGEEAETHHG